MTVAYEWQVVVRDENGDGVDVQEYDWQEALDLLDDTHDVRLVRWYEPGPEQDWLDNERAEVFVVKSTDGRFFFSHDTFDDGHTKIPKRYEKTLLKASTHEEARR